MDDTLSRKRAVSALDAIEKFKDTIKTELKKRDLPKGAKDAEDAEEKYLSYIKEMPVLIHRHGLGQALATILAQSQGQGNKLAYLGIYKHLQDWLCSGTPSLPFKPADLNNDGSLLKCVLNSNQKTYFEAQNEAGLYIELLKKFANAFLSDDLEVEEASAPEAENEGEPS